MKLRLNFKNNTPLYQHYKNKLYLFLFEAKHSETMEYLVVYKTLYKNDQSFLWVRPKEMFYEDIEVNGVATKRFKQVELNYFSYEKITQELITEIVSQFKSTFQDLSEKKIQEKLKSFQEILLICVYDNETLIGFKLGYKLNENTFYSWLGAVILSYRSLGIGQTLYDQQLKWCLEKNIKEIKTKSMNRWPQMLSLNIKNGFTINGTELDKNGETKILMTKSLKKSLD